MTELHDLPEGMRSQLDSPSFQGLATFGQQPFVTEPEQLDTIKPHIAVIGAPWDDSTTNRPGARFGPRALRANAYNPGTYHLDLGVEIFEHLKVVDFGDSKMLFYLELGLNDHTTPAGKNKEYINVERAYELMVFPGNMHLNWIGLIFMANITNLDRSKEKGVHIDDARLEIINTVLLPHVANELFRDTVRLGGSIRKNSKKSVYKSTRRIIHPIEDRVQYGLDQESEMKARQTEKKRNTHALTQKFRQGLTKHAVIKEVTKKIPRAFVIPNKLNVTDDSNILNVTLSLSKNKHDSYLYIVFVLFPSIFDTNFLLYSFSQGVFLENLFNSTSLNIKSLLEQFNSDLLDSPGGNVSLSKDDTDLLSIRQLIILWVTKLENTFKNESPSKFRIQVAGGDVFRLYLSTIQTTSDLDFKLFYTNRTDEFQITRFILFITFIITFYFHINNYFRISKTLYTVNIDKYTFIRSINTTEQDIIPSVRILPDFIVPLVSIDLNLNGFIECPQMSFGPTRYNRSRVIIPASRIKVVHSTAPLDISINHSKYLPNISRRPDRHCLPIKSISPLLRKHKDEITGCDKNNLTIPSVNMKKERLLCLPPNPDIDYLYEDLYNIVDLDMRPHKREKDIARLRTIKSKIENKDMSYDYDRLFDIEQFGCSKSDRYSKLNDSIQVFLDGLIIRNVHKDKKITKPALSGILRELLHEFWEHLQMNNGVNVTPDFLVDVFSLPIKSTTIDEYQMPHSFLQLLKDTKSPLYDILYQPLFKEKSVSMSEKYEDPRKSVLPVVPEPAVSLPRQTDMTFFSRPPVSLPGQVNRTFFNPSGRPPVSEPKLPAYYEIDPELHPYYSDDESESNSK
jgi:hypothetical protein